MSRQIDSSDRGLSILDLIRYGVFACPLAFVGLPIYLHVVDLYTTIFGVSLAFVGMILLLVRAFDAVQDPIIGYFSDAYPLARTKVMVISSVVLAASFYALFSPLTDHYALNMIITLILCSVCFSVLYINYYALGVLWAEAIEKSSVSKATRISAFREFFGLIGLIVAAVLPSILQLYVSASDAYGYFALVLCVVFALAGLSLLSWSKKNEFITLSKKESHSLKSVFAVFKSRKKAWLYFIYALSMFASAVPAVLFIYFVRDVLNLYDFMGLFLMVYFLSAAVSTFVWYKLPDLIGKYQAWLLAMVLAIVSFIFAFTLTEGAFWPYLVICAVTGFALGAELTIPPALLSNYIGREGHKEHSAIHFAALGFITKLSLALATGLSLIALSYFEFSPGEVNAPDSLLALSTIYGLIPCCLKLIAALTIFLNLTTQTEGASNEKASQKPNNNRSNYHA